MVPAYKEILPQECVHQHVAETTMVSKVAATCRKLEVRELCLNRNTREKPISSWEKGKLWSEILTQLTQMNHFWELGLFRIKWREGIFVITTWMRRNLTFPWCVDPPFRRKKKPLCLRAHTLVATCTENSVWSKMNRQEWNETLENFPTEVLWFRWCQRLSKMQFRLCAKMKGTPRFECTHIFKSKTLDHNQLKTWHKRRKSQKQKTKQTLIRRPNTQTQCELLVCHFLQGSSVSYLEKKHVVLTCW